MQTSKESIWDQLLHNFNPSDWQSIDKVATELPSSDADLSDVLNWLSAVIRENEGDGALAGLSLTIEKWVTFHEDRANQVRENLSEIATSTNTNRFLMVFVRALQKIRPISFAEARDNLTSAIHPTNSFYILSALAFLSNSDSQARLDYLDLLLENTKKSLLPVQDFVTICSRYGLYDTNVLEMIDKHFEFGESQNLLVALLDFLEGFPEQENMMWYERSLYLAFSKSDPGLISLQNRLLEKEAERSMLDAYKFIFFRFKVMGGNNLLEGALTRIILKDIPYFQSHLVKWFIADDHYVHIAIRQLCETQTIPPKAFFLSSELLISLEEFELQYIAAKGVGYIYSMEALQQFLISIAYAITNETSELQKLLFFIYTEYLVYNYRGTLDLIHRELQATMSLKVRSFFMQVLEYFDVYFSARRAIDIERELAPYPQMTQLQKFYFKRAFSDLPDKMGEGSIRQLFKNVSINSHAWAIRRPTEMKHTPQPLGTISITKEFPSGETLNPFFQEEIRKSYQKLKLYETDID